MSWGNRWTQEQLEALVNRRRPAEVLVDHVPRGTKLNTEDVTPAVPKKRQEIEHKMQVALFEHAALHLLPYPDLEWLHAVPNGGFRHKATAGRMKAEGVKNGIPDVFLPVPRGGYHGLYIELKAPDQLTRPDQNRCIRYLRGNGYYVQVFDDWYKAWQCVIDYLEEKLT